MRRTTALSWRRRTFVALVLAFGALVFSTSNAFADAGNPILGTIRYSATDNGNGTVTIYVRGQWNWLSHNSDCNNDRNGTGVGIIWNDPTEPGFVVTKGAISAQIGISALRPGDTVNTIDQMVHPADRGNLVEGYATAGVDYPAGQQFVDPPAAAPPTAAQLAAWRGGCGREPLAATASKGSHPERSGKTCGDGTVTCAGHPWGSWGYEKNGGLGYSHTYLKSALPSSVCVNFYDVHGSNAGLQAPNGLKEITVDDNGDNSIETNSFDVHNGANCISIAVATVTTTIHNAAHQGIVTAQSGETVHDSVTVTGAQGTPTGTVTVDWFTNGTCSGNAQSTSAATALANGTTDVTSFPKGLTGAGFFSFRAHYAGNGTYLPADGVCEPLRLVDANIQINPPTGVNLLGQNHVLTAHVNVNDGSGYVNAPNGTAIGFVILGGPGQIVGASTCATTGGTGSCSVTIVSQTPGTTTVRAITNASVSGLTLHRESGDSRANDSADATKLWAAPGLSILKEPKSQTVAIGGTATFRITVANTGNVTLTDVAVSDPNAPNCSKTKADIPALASLAPGARVSYTCTRPNVRVAFNNVATATATPPVGPALSAIDTAPVRVAPLKPAKKKVKKPPKVTSHKKPKATG